jgi:predicted DCC family thiol-disulfide oxidoreductase YuxK
MDAPHGFALARERNKHTVVYDFKNAADLSARPVSEADLNSRQWRNNRSSFSTESVAFAIGRLTSFCRKIGIRNFCLRRCRGETFKALVKDHPEASAVDSAFVLCYTAQGEQLLMRSDAMFYILGQLPQFRWIARIGHFIPRPIRDAVYRLIASTRYRVWGKRDSCRLPTPEEKQRFLP